MTKQHKDLPDHKTCRRRALNLVEQLGVVQNKIVDYVHHDCQRSGLPQCKQEVVALRFAIDKLRFKLKSTNGREA